MMKRKKKHLKKIYIKTKSKDDDIIENEITKCHYLDLERAKDLIAF